MSWEKVEAIRDRFRALNPYGDGKSILELEDENYAPCGLPKHKPTCVCTKRRRQLYTYSVADKRYALFNLDAGSDVVLLGLEGGEDAESAALRDDESEAALRKYSQHGLDAYEAPRDPETGKKIEKCERAVWYYLIQRALGRSVKLPTWAYQPTLTQIRISTPVQLGWFDTYNRTAEDKKSRTSNG